MIKALNPDVITLDIEMPNMNGLEFLEKIMRLRPMPVVMVSTLTQRGADATLAALELGAVDYVGKPTDGAVGAFEASGPELVQKVKSAAKARVRSPGPRGAPRIRESENYVPAEKVIAIGASTGGVEALIEVLSVFPRNCSPTVITQHMPARFTTTFAQRLARNCNLNVEEATDGAILEPGRIYLAPGGETHLEISGHATLRCKLVHSQACNGHRPSVDVLFHSVAKVAQSGSVGVILTGMGRDGAMGLKALRDAGAATLGQDEASSVIYGMPRVAFELGAVAHQLPLDRIGPEIVRLCESRK
jgi:two-component system chemotaxis response regulator CheB